MCQFYIGPVSEKKTRKSIRIHVHTLVKQVWYISVYISMVHIIEHEKRYMKENIVVSYVGSASMIIVITYNLS